MSDNRSRHDRLAVRLSLIISRLMAGESLSLKTLSDEFGVTERTFTARFSSASGSPRFRVQKWQVQPQTTEQPSAIPEMLSLYRIPGSHGYFRSGTDD